MILYIDTTKNDLIEIGLKKGGEFVARKKIKAERRQAEKLLPAVEKMLKAAKLKLSGIKKIEVENRGGSFTSLRVGVVTANALGYALGIGVNGKRIVEPEYDREPEITEKKIK
ncbi:MAG: hypothetical protein Q8O93_01655 [bacterium]|nr:hypothetical protein [bacterium]